MLRLLLMIALIHLAQSQQEWTLPQNPRILFNCEEVASLKKKVASVSFAKAKFEAMKEIANSWLTKRIELPNRGGQWFHYYSCPKHGSVLSTQSPTKHVCPVDNEVFTGYPYDDVAITFEHSRFAEGLRILGIVHQLTGDAKYAAKAKEILMAYAEKYQSYKLHDKGGKELIGGGKVSAQSLDESVWLIAMVEGADCIWVQLSEDERKKVKEGLLMPAVEVIRKHKLPIHNIQCWKNSAVALAAILMGNKALFDEAVDGEFGYKNQVKKGATADGVWYEGSWGYHFYTLMALLHLTEASHWCGIDLYGDELKKMFEAPLAFCMPNLELPAFNDSHAESVLSRAELYEIALARYGSDAFKIPISKSGRNSDKAMLYGIADMGRVPVNTRKSANFPDSGYAVLSSATTWLCLKYGPHGGGHGHPDKLGFVLFSNGAVVAPDPGTCTYGIPPWKGWYRTTIAHNTLTINEDSQKETKGSCDAFIAADGFCAVSATAGKIWKGLTFRRTVSSIGNNMLLFIDEIQSDSEHTLDIAYHNIGKFEKPKEFNSFQLPDKPGYSYMKDACSFSTKNGMKLVFDKTIWSMAGGEDTQYILATEMGTSSEDRVPIVIARRTARETVYAWTVSTDDAKIVLERKDGYCVTTVNSAEVVVTNFSGAKIKVGGIEFEGRVAHLQKNSLGLFRLLHEAK